MVELTETGSARDPGAVKQPELPLRLLHLACSLSISVSTAQGSVPSAELRGEVSRVTEI